MYARGSELDQQTHACNGNPAEEEDAATDVLRMKKTNGNEGNCESPLLEIDENYVCDIAMMRIGGGEEAAAGSLSMKHNAHMDESPGGNNENEVEIDRQEEEQAVSDLVRLSGAGALMEA